MMTGHFRDRFPRVRLPLPGRDGSTVHVEFVLDTGFDGELAIPQFLLGELDAAFLDNRPLLLADGTVTRQRFFAVALQWYDETRVTEIAVLNSGNPLIGMALLEDHLLQIEVMDGGDVSIEPL